MTFPRLQKHRLPGMLIVFEGIDGCGKGTQIEMLVGALKREGWGDRLVMNKQPGATKLGNGIRDLLFHSVTTHEMAPDAASLLFFASHVQSLHDVVMPALEAGKVVISDRWCAYSDTAFGLYGLSKPISKPLVDVRMTLSGPEPDLLFFLHGDPATLLARANGRTGETHEQGKAWAKADTLSMIQECYCDLFRPMIGAPDSPLVPLHAECSPDELFGNVWNAVFRKVRRHFDL